MIPHYRDAGRLEPFLRELVAGLTDSFGVLVSDDGSGDLELGRLRDVVERCRGALREGGTMILDPVVAERNAGKGAAVYAGWRAGLAEAGGVRWDALAFADADGAVNVGEIRRGVGQFERRAGEIDGLIGCRVKMLGRRVERQLTRHLSGRVFATMVKLIAGLDTYDSQCGFKIFKREAVERFVAVGRSYGFAFDVELLLMAEKFGYRVEEFPVDWRDVRGGKVSLLRDPLPMLVDVWRVRERVGRVRR